MGLHALTQAACSHALLTPVSVHKTCMLYRIVYTKLSSSLLSQCGTSTCTTYIIIFRV